MKAAAVDYARPRSREEAVAMLARSDVEARIVAGGQSLLAMMNLRVATPDLLVDVSRLPELLAVAEDGAAVTLGAAVTHAMIEDGRVPDPSYGLMPRAAASLAYRAIRNRGTLGGSLALADPAAEWPAVLMTLDAEAMLFGPGGSRVERCADFVTGIFETTLGAGEIVEAVRLRKLSEGARWGYVKLARKTGEFASALAVAVVDPGRGYARVVLGAANGAPLILAETSRRLAERGASLSDALAADLDAAADRHLDEFQRHLAEVAAMRAVKQALQ